jgi:glucose-6-phosphate isomerase
MLLQYDYHFMLETSIGEVGWSRESVVAGLEHLAPFYAEVQAEKSRGELGFTKLPTASIEEIQTLAAAVRCECETLLVIGIGGSDLGTRAVHRALNHQFYNQLPAEKRGGPRLFFVGDTTDPVALQEVLDVVDIAKTVVCIVSKSGNTIEQMSTLLYLRDRLKSAVGEEQLKQHIIVITDAEKGTLRDMVRSDGYRSLVVPADVGGRFSVLASVGLFPLAVVGVDITALLAGARKVDEADSSMPISENPAALFALFQYLGYEREQHISVFMPYRYALRDVGFWYRQLWAESLGKALNLEGDAVYHGPTPIAALGPTDQHSQLQLYAEGPADKLFTFVTTAEVERDGTVPEAYPELEGAHYLKEQSFSAILQAEVNSTALSLAEVGRPSATFRLQKLDAESIGALLYTLELATTYAGKLFHVNTFDQPGVEYSKNLMYGLLGRAGYEKPKLAEVSEGVATIA